MKRMGLSASVFLLFVFVCMGIMWLGGYDFDHRSENVALGAVCVLMCSGCAGAFTWMFLE